MRAIRSHIPGELNLLKLDNIPIPHASKGDVLVQIKAAAINPSDVGNAKGAFSYTTRPRILGRDYSGVVVEGPPKWIGKEVWGTGGKRGFLSDGTHAEYCIIPEDSVRLKPTNLSFTEAASVGVGFLTAWYGLMELAELKEKESILVIGATGAVGSACVQIAKWKKAFVIGTARSDSKFSSKLSTPDATIHLETENMKDKVMDITNTNGVNVVFNTVGAMLEQGLLSLAIHGRQIEISTPSKDYNTSFNLLNFYRRQLKLFGADSLGISSLEAANIMDKLKVGFEEGILEPPVTKEFPFEKALEAYELVQKGSRTKVVLIP